ncbi:MAG TPA: SDR family NAD(P)-dependent oxidoreductase [Solirubrobacteraceae bacterium]|nr:SDR family NAD(P)-dependent oxidoreductase [Solirubrobacteraceae bacterium]
MCARVALVTGASAGIGEATARALAPSSRLVLVARREDRLRSLAAELGGATVIAADLADPDCHARIAETVRREHGALHLLVNNAGARWPGAFAETGWENVARHLLIDLEAPVRLTEALLPLLRETAAALPAGAGEDPVSIVNVASTAARIGRPGAGGYSAAKFALAGWSDSLAAEEVAHGIHVGLVLPGFVQTEGFPAEELLASWRTRWIVARPELAAEAILRAAGWGDRRPRAEVYVPRPYAAMAALRTLTPALVRRAVATGAFTTAARPRD